MAIIINAKLVEDFVIALVVFIFACFVNNCVSNASSRRVTLDKELCMIFLYTSDGAWFFANTRTL